MDMNTDINDLVDYYDNDNELITTDDDDNVGVSLSGEESDIEVEETPTNIEVVVVKPLTKTQIAQEIFTRMYGKEGIERKHIIKMFESDALLTHAGAGTYYQKFTNKVK